jgi:GTPase SAR1 family protein
LTHCIKSFIDNIDRIGRSDFVPNLNDILRVREPTTAIIEHKYKIQDTDFLFVDVGGQRSERRKWMSCFESVSNIMFVASLSDYDLFLTKDELRGTQINSNENINRLKEALDLFQTTINWKKRVYYHTKDSNGNNLQKISEELLFKNVGIVLFLNKTDLFYEKILQSPLKSCFNEFDDSAFPVNNRADVAKSFIAKKFTFHVEDDRNFYCHYTYALDRDSMEIVIQAVKERIIEDMLKNLML